MTWQYFYLRALDVMAERERELEQARLAREARAAREHDVRSSGRQPGGFAAARRSATTGRVRLDRPADARE